jgi:hypothetical protein
VAWSADREPFVRVLFTLALPPLIWALVLCVRRRRRLRDARVVDDFATVGS